MVRPYCTTDTQQDDEINLGRNKVLIDNTISKYHYTINENNEIKIWDTTNPNEGGKPFFYQPDHPDGRPWDSIEEAHAWVQYIISEWEKPPVVVEQ